MEGAVMKKYFSLILCLWMFMFVACGCEKNSKN